MAGWEIIVNRRSFHEFLGFWRNRSSKAFLQIKEKLFFSKTKTNKKTRLFS